MCFLHLISTLPYFKGVSVQIPYSVDQWHWTQANNTNAWLHVAYLAHVIFSKRQIIAFLCLRTLDTMPRNYFAWGYHQYKQYKDLKNVALSRRENGYLFPVGELIEGRGWLCSASSGNAHIGDSEFCTSCNICKRLKKCFKYWFGVYKYI